MPDAIDAVIPLNIPASWNGKPVHRITVLNDPAGQVFDVESGNVNPDADARSILQRTMAGKWSIGYTNEEWFGRFTNALAALELRWLDAALWPQPGVYLWAASPGTSPGTIPPWCPVTPVMVQDRWLSTIDLSTVYGPYPGRAGGYLDGPRSQWPADAWQRFQLLPDLPPPPAPDPPAGDPTPQEDQGVLYIVRDETSGSEALVDTSELPNGKGIRDTASTEAYCTALGIKVVNVTSAEYATYRVI